MPDLITTPRLSLRRFPALGSPDHTSALLALRSHRRNPDIMKYSARGAPDQTIDQAIAYMKRQAREPWTFLIVERDSSAIKQPQDQDADDEDADDAEDADKADDVDDAGEDDDGADDGADDDADENAEANLQNPQPFPIGEISLSFPSPNPVTPTLARGPPPSTAAGPIPYLSFWIAPSSQKRGYATEALGQLLQEFWESGGESGGESGASGGGETSASGGGEKGGIGGNEQVWAKVDTIEATSDPDNVACEKVLRKVGFEVRERREKGNYVKLLGGWRELVVWRMGRPGVAVEESGEDDS